MRRRQAGSRRTVPARGRPQFQPQPEDGARDLPLRREGVGGKQRSQVARRAVGVESGMESRQSLSLGREFGVIFAFFLGLSCFPEVTLRSDRLFVKHS